MITIPLGYTGSYINGEFCVYNTRFIQTEGAYVLLKTRILLQNQYVAAWGLSQVQLMIGILIVYKVTCH